MILVANFLYAKWVGKEIKVDRSITLLLGLYVTMVNWNAIFTYFLNGIGKIRLQLYCYIIVGIIGIPMAIFLGKALGVPGVILSMIICLTFSAILAPIQYHKIIHGKAKGLWLK